MIQKELNIDYRDHIHSNYCFEKFNARDREQQKYKLTIVFHIWNGFWMSLNSARYNLYLVTRLHIN